MDNNTRIHINLKKQNRYFTSSFPFSLSALAMTVGLIFSTNIAWSKYVEPDQGEGGYEDFSENAIIGTNFLNDKLTVGVLHDDTYGVYAKPTGASPSISINVDRSIINSIGDRAHGIYALIEGMTTSKGININQQGGEISTNGLGSQGIYAKSSASSGDINIALTAQTSIITKGKDSSGLMAIADNTNNADIGINVAVSNGSISTEGEESHGIYAKSLASSGNIDIIVNNSKIAVEGTNSDGIGAFTDNAAGSNIDINIKVTNTTIKTLDSAAQPGMANYGIVAIQSGAAAAGNILIENVNSNISTGLGSDGIGQSSSGIRGQYQAADATGNITISNSGSVSTQGNVARGIEALNAGAGMATITNSGQINTKGETANGLYAETVSGNININNSGAIVTQGKESSGVSATSDSGRIDLVSQSGITTSDAKGIYALTNSNDVNVKASGNITTGQVTSSLENHGIEAAVTNSGNVKVDYSNGTIKVTNVAGGAGSTAIKVWDTDLANANINTTVNIGANAIIDASKGFAAIHASSNGTNTVLVAAGAKVHGGSAQAINFGAAGAGAVTHILNNAGDIDSFNDQAIVTSFKVANTGSTLTVNNTGSILGYLTLNSEDTTFNNQSGGVWELRNYFDSDLDGVKDEKKVAITDFGTGTDTVKNEAGAIIRLAAVTGEQSIDSSSEYVPFGALSTANAGIVQGQLTNLDRFEHRGIIDLTANGLAGDVFAISGGATAGTYGGNQFLSDGGIIKLDTVLNEGDVSTLSDILVVDDVVLGSSATKIIVNRVDGMGGATVGNGIKLIEVLGTADEGSFELLNIARGGLYEYTLHQGAVDLSDGHYYLRTTGRQINPDVGSYLANQTAATGIFMHSLHDRLGETQYYNHYDKQTAPAVWVRAVVERSKNQAAGGLLKQNVQNSLVHLGMDVASWTGQADNRYHLGLMAAYGRNETKTTSNVTGSQVKSNINGYGAGAYFTWYNDPTAVEGWYSDIWSMYNWFDNETEGSDKYKSKSWTSSLELGYALKVSQFSQYDLMMEPQTQLAYNYYDVKNIQDQNGLQVSDPKGNGFVGRLGVRTFLTPSKQTTGAQPFVEVNWLYNSAQNSMVFNGKEVSDDTPKNRFETKVGVQGQINNNVHLYSHIGLQWGKNNYESAQGQLGIRYRF